MKSAKQNADARKALSQKSLVDGFAVQSNTVLSHGLQADLKNVRRDCLTQVIDRKLPRYDPEVQEDKYISKGIPEVDNPKQVSFVIKVLLDELPFAKKLAESILVQAVAAAGALALAAKNLDDFFLQVDLLAKGLQKMFEFYPKLKSISAAEEIQDTVVIMKLAGVLIEQSCNSYFNAQLKECVNCINSHCNKPQFLDFRKLKLQDESKQVVKKKYAAIEGKPEEEVEKELKKVLRQTTSTAYRVSLASFLSAACNNLSVVIKKGLVTLESSLNTDKSHMNFPLSESDEPKEEPMEDACFADKDQDLLSEFPVSIPDSGRPQALHQDDVGGVSGKDYKCLHQICIDKHADDGLRNDSDGMAGHRRQRDTVHIQGMLSLEHVLKLMVAELHIPDAAAADEKGPEWTSQGRRPEKEGEEISDSYDESTGLSSSSRPVERAAIHPNQIADRSHVQREEDSRAKHLLQMEPQTRSGSSPVVRDSLACTDLEIDGMEHATSVTAEQGSASHASPSPTDTEVPPTQMNGPASGCTSDSSHGLSADRAEKQYDMSASRPCQAAQNFSAQVLSETSGQLVHPLNNSSPSLCEEQLESQQGAISGVPDTGSSPHSELVSTACAQDSLSTHLRLPCAETPSCTAASSLCPSASAEDYCQPLESQSAGYDHHSLEDVSADYYHRSLDAQPPGYQHQSMDVQSAVCHHQSHRGQLADFHIHSVEAQSACYYQSPGSQAAGFHHRSPGSQAAGCHQQSPGSQSAGFHHQSRTGQSTGCHHQSPIGQAAGCHQKSPGSQSIGCHHQSAGGQSSGCHHQSAGGQSSSCLHQSAGNQSSSCLHQSAGGQSSSYLHQSAGGQSSSCLHQSAGGQSAGLYHHPLENHLAVSVHHADTSLNVQSAENNQPMTPAHTRPRIDLSQAANRHYAHMRMRVATYREDWPQGTGITTTDMALSGFYVLDADERRVRCFYCGLELQDINHGDNIWDEHVRYRPTCAYLRAIMGPDMVLRTQIALARGNK